MSKPCRQCKEAFEPLYNTTQPTCSPKCALAYTRAKEAAKVSKAFNTETKRRRKAARTLPQWRREYTRYFNRFIVLRDHSKPCPTCGTYLLDPPAIWHCGHYKPVSTHPHLAYVESNAHKQCSNCNTGSQVSPTKNITVSRAYDIEIINRVGSEEAARLNSPLPVLQLRIPDIEPQVEIYRQRCKEIKKGINCL